MKEILKFLRLRLNYGFKSDLAVVLVILDIIALKN
jgi:hypothetical protein